MKCQYYGSGEACGEEIVEDLTSPSGYKHVATAGWFHWASPTPYGKGVTETERIFKPCQTCGKTQPGNEAHVKYSGHRFTANLEAVPA